jgi:hypothetical protein
MSDVMEATPAALFVRARPLALLISETDAVCAPALSAALSVGDALAPSPTATASRYARD